MTKDDDQTFDFTILGAARFAAIFATRTVGQEEELGRPKFTAAFHSSLLPGKLTGIVKVSAAHSLFNTSTIFPPRILAMEEEVGARQFVADALAGLRAVNFNPEHVWGDWEISWNCRSYAYQHHGLNRIAVSLQSLTVPSYRELARRLEAL